MIQRFLNRHAQSYLVRAGGPLPQVGPPESNTAGSVDWHLAAANVAGAFHILSPDRQRSLSIEGDSLVYNEMPRTVTDSDGWFFESVGDGTDYQYVVSVDDRDLTLGVTSGRSQTSSYQLGARRGRDRASMWLRQDDSVADARSVHLRYQAPRDIVLFYNEVYPESAPSGTFFCTSGFGANAQGSRPSGYAGIQTRPDGSTRAIFSVWHRMADDVHAVDGAMATAVAVHSKAHVTPFSGEGSGSSIRLPFDWSDVHNQKVRVCLAAEALEADTVITAYIAPGDEPWVSVGAILRAETGGAPMTPHMRSSRTSPVPVVLTESRGLSGPPTNFALLCLPTLGLRMVKAA